MEESSPLTARLGNFHISIQVTGKKTGSQGSDPSVLGLNQMFLHYLCGNLPPPVWVSNFRSFHNLPTIADSFFAFAEEHVVVYMYVRS